MSFVYGNPIHPVVGRGRADLLGRVGALDPGVRVGGGHLAEARPQLGDGDQVLVEARGRARSGGPARTAGTPAPASRRRGPSRPGRTWRRPASTAGLGARRRPARSSPARRRACGRPSGCATPRRRRAARGRRRRAWMARQAWFTSDCGLLPPMPVTASCARGGAEALRRRARRGRGSATTGVDTMWMASAPVSAASPAPVSSAARRSGLGDEVDGLERRLAAVDALAELAGADQHRGAGIDHELLRLDGELDWSVKSREREVAHLQSPHRRAPPLHRQPVPLADGGGPAAPPPRRAGRRGDGVVGRAVPGGQPGHRRRRRGRWPTGVSTSAAHRSRQIDARAPAGADLVIGMAREHVREVAVARRRRARQDLHPEGARARRRTAVGPRRQTSRRGVAGRSPAPGRRARPCSASATTTPRRRGPGRSAPRRLRGHGRRARRPARPARRPRLARRRVDEHAGAQRA